MINQLVFGVFREKNGVCRGKMELALTTGSWELKSGEERLGIVKSFRGNSRSFENRTGRQDEIERGGEEEIEMEREGRVAVPNERATHP